MSLRLLAWGVAIALAAVVIGALARGLGHPMAPPASSVSMVGRPAPDLTLRTPDGRTFQLARLRGRPVVLNFWASGCSGCRPEAAALDAQARASGGAVQFLGVDIQDSAAAAESFEADVKDPYPTGTLVRGDESYYQVSSPPQTFFIDARGRIVAHFVGPLDVPTLAMYMGQLSA